MPSGPAVFVSSTYYDLREVRANIGRLVSDLGYSELRSELDTFPIDPDLETVENCRRIVQRQADILVLIVGGRYGFVPDDLEKSVTNLEYETARSKGIPIFVFISSDLLALLPTYKANPDGDFSHAVDNTRVFDFVTDIRSSERRWTFEFRNADEIASTLKAQLAVLFRDALTYRTAIHREKREWLTSLSPAAFRLAVEQPTAWEYLLFGQTLSDAVNLFEADRDEYRFGLAIGPTQQMSLRQFTDIVGSKISELNRLVESMSILIDTALPDALGEPGQPGNPRKIVFVASKLAEIYKGCLMWSHGVRRIVVPSRGKKVVSEFARFPEYIVDDIERYGTEITRSIKEGLTKGTEDNPSNLSLKLTLRLNHGEFHSELKALSEWLEIYPEYFDTLSDDD